MATGDSNDILRRVKYVIPNRWFAYTAPIRDAVLGGLSDGMAWLYQWIIYAKAQSRIFTAYGIWLDIIARDFTGRYLQRKGASDANFRARIQATILQERVTRAGMVSALTKLTGAAPQIFEPWNCRDTGAYGKPNIGYGRAGGYGSLQLPAQCFITVPTGASVKAPNTSGYGSPLAGYGVGATEYVGPGVEGGDVTNADIYATIMATKPTGTICWTQIL